MFSYPFDVKYFPEKIDQYLSDFAPICVILLMRKENAEKSKNYQKMWKIAVNFGYFPILSLLRGQEVKR